MFENWYKFLGSLYANVSESRAFEITFITCSILLCLLFFIMLLDLLSACFKYHGKSKVAKTKKYKPTAHFKKSLANPKEDSIYFSEVSPSSSDSICNSSTHSSCHESTISVASEEDSKSWFPLAITKKIRQKQKTETPITIHLHIKFVSNNVETNQQGKLHITIKNITSLPIKDYPRYTEAYLIIQMVHTQHGIRGRTDNVIYENRTRNFRNTRAIDVNEHFILDTKKNDWKNWKIVLTAFDQDIYTKPKELASTEILLSRKYKEIINNCHGLELISHLKPSSKNLGSLLIGLSYLPTSQRLSVNIVKAANLPHKNDDTKMKLYAQLFLLTGVTGRSLKRKKLIFNSPLDDTFELNGTVSFDITPHLLETVTLLIILYEKGSEPDKADIFENIESDELRKYISDDYCYGSVAIGKLVTNQKGKKHWRMMMAAPRRIVTVWHSLK